MMMFRTAAKAPQAPASRGTGGSAFRRLFRSWGASAGTIFLLLLIAMAVFAPWLSPYAATEVHTDAVLQTPSSRFWLGTDEIGRDLLTRLMYGIRLTFLVAGGSVVVAMVIGTIWGFAAGLGARWLEEVLMRLVDGAMAIPSFLLALMFVASFGSSTLGLIAIIGLLNAPVVARLARAVVLEENGADYAVAAHASGATSRRILWRELFPNTVPALLVQAALIAGYAIITEAGLSFLGLGVQPPTTSLGSLLLQGYQNLYTYPGYVIWPGVVIVAAVWALNTVGDSLRAVLDPRAES